MLDNCSCTKIDDIQFFSKTFTYRRTQPVRQPEPEPEQEPEEDEPPAEPAPVPPRQPAPVPTSPVSPAAPVKMNELLFLVSSKNC